MAMHQEIVEVNKRVAALNFGQTTFDDVVRGWFTIFHMITLERWSSVMFQLWDYANDFQALLQLVLLLIVGNFFALNLILAILSNSVGELIQLEPRPNKHHPVGRRYSRGPNMIYSHAELTLRVNNADYFRKDFAKAFRSRYSIVANNFDCIFTSTRLKDIEDKLKQDDTVI